MSNSNNCHPQAEDQIRLEKIEICKNLLEKIEESFIFVANEVYFERLQCQIHEFESKLIEFEKTYLKYPHKSSLKNLIINLLSSKKTSSEIFYFLKQVMSESNYEIMQYCCLADAKFGLINLLEALISSFISLVARVSGRQVAAQMYAQFSLPKPINSCQTCPRIKKKINQEVYRLNMMLAGNTIKNFLSVTPEDEIKVRQELQEQREQEENEDFSEVSDFSCLSHLSGDSAFLNDNKDKYSELQALVQKTVNDVKNRENNHNSNASLASNLSNIQSESQTSRRTKSSSHIISTNASSSKLNTTLEYQTKHAEIAIPKWEIVNIKKMIQEASEAAIKDKNNIEENYSKSLNNTIKQQQKMESLDDEIFMKRHHECEIEEKNISIPKKRKTSSNNNAFNSGSTTT